MIQHILAAPERGIRFRRWAVFGAISCLQARRGLVWGSNH